MEVDEIKDEDVSFKKLPEGACTECGIVKKRGIVDGVCQACRNKAKKAKKQEKAKTKEPESVVEEQSIPAAEPEIVAEKVDIVTEDLNEVPNIEEEKEPEIEESVDEPGDLVVETEVPAEEIVAEEEAVTDESEVNIETPIDSAESEVVVEEPPTTEEPIIEESTSVDEPEAVISESETAVEEPVTVEEPEAVIAQSETVAEEPVAVEEPAIEESIPVEESVPVEKEEAAPSGAPSTLTVEYIQQLMKKNENGDMTQKEFYHVFLLTAQTSGVLEKELQTVGNRLVAAEKRIEELTEAASKEAEKQTVVETRIEPTEEEDITNVLEQLEEESTVRVSSLLSRKRLRVSNSSATSRTSRGAKSRKIQ